MKEKNIDSIKAKLIIYKYIIFKNNYLIMNKLLLLSLSLYYEIESLHFRSNEIRIVLNY